MTFRELITEGTDIIGRLELEEFISNLIGNDNYTIIKNGGSTLQIEVETNDGTNMFEILRDGFSKTYDIKVKNWKDKNNKINITFKY